jgi:hypothetical protein
MSDPNNFDEFAWFNSLGIPAITYTPAEIEALKVKYIEDNLIPLYEISKIVLYGNTQEGLPLFVIDLGLADKIGAGYREDQNVQVFQEQDLLVRLEKILDTKSPNAFTVSASLKRI